MKKLLLSLFAVTALALTTQAQTEKGNYMIGGNVEFNSEKVDGNSKADIDFAIVPSIGYFISDNFAVGTGIGYQFAKSYSESGVNSVKTQAFVVSPFARYYAGITEQFKFFGQLSVPMSFGNTKASTDNGDNYYKTNNNNSVGVALSPGFAFFPSKKFGIEFSVNGISYNDNRLENANGDKITGNKNFNIGANFFAPKIGVQFYL